jgi:hypothetical protein
VSAVRRDVVSMPEIGGSSRACMDLPLKIR